MIGTGVRLFPWDPAAAAEGPKQAAVIRSEVKGPELVASLLHVVIRQNRFVRVSTAFPGSSFTYPPTLLFETPKNLSN